MINTIKKEGFNMSTICLLDNMEYLLANSPKKTKTKKQEIKEEGFNLKFYIIRKYLSLKSEHWEVIEELIRKNIVRDKSIRGGQPIIKGTRISPMDIYSILNEGTCKTRTIEYILEQYPSLSEKEVLASFAHVLFNEHSTSKFIFKVLFG